MFMRAVQRGAQERKKSAKQSKRRSRHGTRQRKMRADASRPPANRRCLSAARAQTAPSPRACRYAPLMQRDSSCSGTMRWQRGAPFAAHTLPVP